MSQTADSMDPVKRQYEAYPYPERDPAEERRRLIEGSPSHPVEIDHYLFGGRRDWTRPFRALVAGGGTGDGLIMLAQKLADIGCPAEITYLDLSEASRAVAEARAAARELSSIRFLTADLLEAPRLGPFDYIDCCGVLHHLPDPDAGFRALAGALAPGGGIGLMVYAPYGRTGVYPMQSAFARLLAADPPAEKVRLAREVLGALPETNWFRRNELVGDHRTSDAGLYDLLLHARDRPYTVGQLAAALEQAGLALVSFLEPARYDPLRYLPPSPEIAGRVEALAPLDRAALAEELCGNLKTHVLYAARPGETTVAAPTSPEAVPHLRRGSPAALARHIAASGAITVTAGGLNHVIDMPRSAAPLVARIDGRRSLGAIAAGAGLDWLAFSAAWAPVHGGLTSFNFLHYSRGARR
jgi:SAM-dependent methyltransferase